MNLTPKDNGHPEAEDCEIDVEAKLEQEHDPDTPSSSDEDDHQ